MSKIINSLVQASIDSKNYAGVLLVQLRFNPNTPTEWVRVNNTNQSIFWDEGSGEEEYLGIGRLGSISAMEETNELGAIVMNFTLSGVPQGVTDEAFSDEYRNQPAYVWYATLNPDTYAVEGGANGPVLVFAGLMDYCTVNFGETNTINLQATSRLADWERPRGGRFNQGYQKQYIDPTDDGFEYVIPLQGAEVTWGGSSLGDPGTDGGGSRGLPPSPRPGYDEPQ